MRLNHWAATLVSFLCIGVSHASSPTLDYLEKVDSAEELAKLGKTSDAVKALREALKINGQDGSLWVRLGELAYTAKDWDALLEAADNILSVGAFMNKHKAESRYYAAIAYTQKGDLEAGWKSLEAAMAYGYRNLDTIRKNELLAPLRKNPDWVDLTATHDVKAMSRDEGWRYDIKLLDRELRRLHYAPYLYVSPAERDKTIKTLLNQVPKLSNEQIITEIYRYTASFGDGHTAIRMNPVQRPRLTTFWFEEGIFITGVAPEHKELLGARIVGVQGDPVAKVLEKMNPLMSGENSQRTLALGGNFVTNPVLLKGVGYPIEKGVVDLDVELLDGTRKKVSVPSSDKFQPDATWTSADPSPAPDYLKNRSTPYWFSIDAEKKRLYFQYNAVENGGGEPIPVFAARMFKEAEEKGVTHVIVDVRWNGGGNTFLSTPFLKGFIANPKFSAPGGMYVIIGRNTYSAAQNFTTDLTRYCAPTFVGEPTGSSPNFIGESIRFTLPYSGMNGTVSDLFWQRSWPMDGRNWIPADLPAPPTFKAYRAGIDPALEAINAFENRKEM